MEDYRQQVTMLEDQLSHQQDAYSGSLNAMLAENTRLKKRLAVLESDKKKNYQHCSNCDVLQSKLTELQKDLENVKGQLNEEFSRTAKFNNQPTQSFAPNNSQNSNVYGNNQAPAHAADMSGLQRKSNFFKTQVNPNQNSQLVRHNEKPESTLKQSVAVYPGQRQISGRKHGFDVTQNLGLE